MEEKKEHWLWTILAWPFRVIGHFLSALSMDEKGFSLKKILAAYGTWKAAQFTEAHLEPHNVIVLVAMWLIYAGILVGIYSISDISNAVKNAKSGNSNTEPKQ